MQKNSKKIPIITIDGPSGVGKGTISALLAKHLGWNYLDSGALYRITAYAASLKQIKLISNNEAKIAELALSLDIQFSGYDEVLLDDLNINQKIRTEQCGNNASIIAAMPKIRVALLQKQKDFCIAPGLVADGRDMGSTVFPNARYKIFLTACAKERGKRRYKQLHDMKRSAKVAGSVELAIDLVSIIDEIKQRDARDMNRSVSPLVAASDAMIIDTSELSIDGVFKKILELCSLNKGRSKN